MFCIGGVAFAGHPMLTEDTAAQGTGNAELEPGYSWTSERPAPVLDVDLDSNRDASKTSMPAVALPGAINTFRPGLDVDFGYRAGLNRAAIARRCLLGITFRGAP